MQVGINNFYPQLSFRSKALDTKPQKSNNITSPITHRTYSDNFTKTTQNISFGAELNVGEEYIKKIMDSTLAMRKREDALDKIITFVKVNDILNQIMPFADESFAVHPFVLTGELSLIRENINFEIIDSLKKSLLKLENEELQKKIVDRFEELAVNDEFSFKLKDKVSGVLTDFILESEKNNLSDNLIEYIYTINI